jgi:hypothetical protein
MIARRYAKERSPSSPTMARAELGCLTQTLTLRSPLVLVLMPSSVHPLLLQPDMRPDSQRSSDLLLCDDYLLANVVTDCLQRHYSRWCDMKSRAGEFITSLQAGRAI